MQFIRIFLIIIFYNSSVFAITLNTIPLNGVTESMQYGWETSDKKACKLVETKLFDKARIEASGGETISAESYKICKSSKKVTECKRRTSSFYSIAAIQIIKYEPLKFNNGKECRFSEITEDVNEVTRKGNFILKKLPKQSDNFDFRFSINKSEFFSYPLNSINKLLNKNEKINISIETMEDMYITIFQWLPDQDMHTVRKLFPNSIDQDNFFKIKTKYTIPTSKHYSLRADFPKEEIVLDDEVNEFLMYIGTKEYIDFFDSYNFTDFGKKLASIKNLRQHQESYIIHKRQPD